MFFKPLHSAGTPSSTQALSIPLNLFRSSKSLVLPTDSPYRHCLHKAIPLYPPQSFWVQHKPCSSQYFTLQEFPSRCKLSPSIFMGPAQALFFKPFQLAGIPSLTQALSIPHNLFGSSTNHLLPTDSPCRHSLLDVSALYNPLSFLAQQKACSSNPFIMQAFPSRRKPSLSPLWVQHKPCFSNLFTLQASPPRCKPSLSPLSLWVQHKPCSLHPFKLQALPPRRKLSLSP